MAFVSNDKIQVSLSVNATKTLLMLATQQIDLLKSDNMRLKHRVQELTDQCNEINNKLHEKEQHLDVGPTYKEKENALLTEQEHNGNLTKEVDRLTAILKERDATITELRNERDEFKQYMENTVKNFINSGSLQAEVDALKEQNGELIKQLIDYDVPLPKCAEFTGDAKQTEE